MPADEGSAEEQEQQDERDLLEHQLRLSGIGLRRIDATMTSVSSANNGDTSGDAVPPVTVNGENDIVPHVSCEAEDKKVAQKLATKSSGCKVEVNVGVVHRAEMSMPLKENLITKEGNSKTQKKKSTLNRKKVAEIINHVDEPMQMEHTVASKEAEFGNSPNVSDSNATNISQSGNEEVTQLVEGAEHTCTASDPSPISSGDSDEEAGETGRNTYSSTPDIPAPIQSPFSQQGHPLHVAAYAVQEEEERNYNDIVQDLLDNAILVEGTAIQDQRATEDPSKQAASSNLFKKRCLFPILFLVIMVVIGGVIGVRIMSSQTTQNDPSLGPTPGSSSPFDQTEVSFEQNQTSTPSNTPTALPTSMEPTALPTALPSSKEPTKNPSLPPSSAPTDLLESCELPAYVYYISNDLLFYDDHLDQAKAQHFQLASILSAEENDFVRGFLESDTGFWIGGQRLSENEDEWEWTDGSTWDYHKWAIGEPSNAGPIGGEDKVETKNGNWNDVNRRRYRRAVYKRVVCLSSLSPDGKPRPMNSEFGKDFFCKMTKYVISDDQRQYDYHHEAAQRFGSHLASVHSAAESMVFNLLDQKKSYWIGGQRSILDYNLWEWSDGTNWDFEDWAGGEPNDGYGEGEDRVLVPLYTGGSKWHDRAKSFQSGALYKSTSCPGS